MVRLFIKTDVRDFPQFVDYFYGRAAERSEWGVLASTLHRTISQPNEITVCHDFESLDAAKKFSRANRLRDAMADAGVAHAPQMWITEPVEPPQ